MQTKLFEVRDRMTFIPVMAIQLTSLRTAPLLLKEKYLLSRAGFGLTEMEQGEFFVLIHLEGEKLTYEPHAWGNRTMQEAHKYIRENWHLLMSGDVIDVEYILKETNNPKESEFLSNPLY